MTNDELRAAAERHRTGEFHDGYSKLLDVFRLARFAASVLLDQPQPTTDEQIAELKRLHKSAYHNEDAWKLVAAIPALIARLERAERRAFEAECSGGWVGDEKQTVRILELEGEIERLRKDAARYRFIRQKRVGVLDCTWPLWNSTETLDAAIDAAMQETNDA